MRDPLLSLLANPATRAILAHLAMEPLYTRRLAELVGLSEPETTRRLRALEREGIVTAEWANIGKTVRLYRLKSDELRLRLTPQGIEIVGSRAPRAGPFAALPSLGALFGRDHELEEMFALARTRRRVCVVGIGGIGKTTLVAHLAARWSGPVAWRTAAPDESAALTLHAWASALGAHATDRAPSDDQGALGAWVAQVASASGALLVLDRAEVATDEAVWAAASVAEASRNATIVVVSRVFPKALPRAFASFELGGLPREAAHDLLSSSALDEHARDALFKLCAGHPLALMLAASFAREHAREDVAAFVTSSGIHDLMWHDLLTQLPEIDRDALLRLSVLEVPFSDEEAALVAGVQRPHDLLLRLSARGLVARSREGWLVHDLVRAALAPNAPRAAHRATAKAWANTADPARALLSLQHSLQAEDFDAIGEWIVREAGARERRFAEHGLGAPYVRLLDGAAGHVSSMARAAILLELARIEEDSKRSADLVARARPFVPASGPLRARLLLEEAEVARRDGDPASAIRLLGACAAHALPLLAADALLARAALAEEADVSLVVMAYSRAVEAAERCDDPRLLALAYAGAARAALAHGGVWRPLADEALRLARLSGHLRGEAMARMTLTEPSLDPRATIEDSRNALVHARATLAIARRLFDPWMTACTLADVSVLAARAGEWDEALAAGEEGMEAAAQVASAFLRAGCAAGRATALAAQGDAERGLGILVEAMEAFERQGRGAPYTYALVWLARAGIEESLGRAEEAARARDRAAQLWPR